VLLHLELAGQLAHYPSNRLLGGFRYGRGTGFRILRGDRAGPGVTLHGPAPRWRGPNAGEPPGPGPGGAPADPAAAGPPRRPPPGSRAGGGATPGPAGAAL